MEKNDNTNHPPDASKHVAVLCRGHSVFETYPPFQDWGWSAIVAVNHANDLFPHTHIAYSDDKPHFTESPAIHLNPQVFREFSPKIFLGRHKHHYTSPALIESLGNGCLGFTPGEIHVFGHDMSYRDGAGGPPRRPQAWKQRWVKEWEFWQVAMENIPSTVIFH